MLEVMVMILLLMRHGEAEEESMTTPNQNRALTKKGKKEARQTSKMLAKFLKEQPISIYASPYKRTRETASILSEYCFCQGIITAEELLSDDWRGVENHLLLPGKPIALVSHHPFLSQYLSAMGCAPLPFDTGSIAIVNYDTQWKRGRVIGYISPALKTIKKESK
jgi:phosphohistidine phosphatase